MGVRSPDGPKQSQRRVKKAAPRDANVRVQFGRDARETRSGVAVLEDDELRFHTGRTGRDGKDFFLHIRYDAIQGLTADAHDGTLTFTTPEQGEIVMHVGRIADEWKQMIEDRPSLLDDLGVKPGSRLGVFGVDLDELAGALANRPPDDGGELDIALVGVEHRADLRRMTELAPRMRRPGGVVWVVHPAESRTLPPTADIVAAARTVRLLAGGTIKLTRTHRALKLTRVP